MRRKKAMVAAASEPKAEEVTGVHQLTVDIIRGTRASISSLVCELRSIKEQVEALVHSGDLHPKASEEDPNDGEDGGRS